MTAQFNFAPYLSHDPLILTEQNSGFSSVRKGSLQGAGTPVNKFSKNENFTTS
jgi:hypothetical protein